MANNCILDNGYALGCASVGGVEKVWLGTYSKDASYTFDSDEVVTAVANAPIVYSFEQDQEYAGLEQEGQFSVENGTVYYESNLTLKFNSLDKELRKTIVAIGKAPLYAVVKSNEGLYYILGVETAGRATEGTASLGVAMADRNGAELTITWKSKNGAYLIEDDVLGTDIPVDTATGTGTGT